MIALKIKKKIRMENKLIQVVFQSFIYYNYINLIFFLF